MPNKTLLICAGLGLLVIGALVGGGLFATRGTHLELTGSIRKTRVAPLSATRSVVVVDFRATNPADYPFVLKTAELEVTLKNGEKVVGQFIPESDAKVLFTAIGALGDKLAVSVFTGERIPKKTTVERMVAASFTLPDSDLESRKSLVLRLRDVDGPISELR